jgi:hypothetical protein
MALQATIPTMSQEQENEVLGRTLKEYQAARRRLAALHAEAESLGGYLSTAGYALKTNHTLWAGEHTGGLIDLARWPSAEQITQLLNEIPTAQREKSRLAAILEQSGYKQPE